MGKPTGFLDYRRRGNPAQAPLERIRHWDEFHPMLPEERRCLHGSDGSEKRMCWARPVRIGANCWFGANVVVCPGVTVGEGCVVGAGSVVTRDIPANSFAAGNPCRVIRPITGQDSLRFRPELWGDNSLQW